MVYEEQQIVSMGSNVQERTYILLVNVSCLLLHSLCATNLISGLATSVISTRVSLVRYYTWMNLLSLPSL
jgi:hypothetical protein